MWAGQTKAVHQKVISAQRNEVHLKCIMLAYGFEIEEKISVSKLHFYCYIFTMNKVVER